MAKNLGWCLALAVAAFASTPVFAQEVLLPPLPPALVEGGALLPQFKPHPLMTPEQQEVRSEAARVLLESVSSLPAPDARTLAWLAARVPGLDTKNVKLVSYEIGDTVMSKAAAAKVTWMDVMSDPAFRGSEIFYAPQDMLNRLNGKYVSGLMPVQGRTEDGQAFQMQAFLGGQGKVQLLFSFTEFTYKDDDGKRFKIDNGGRITASIRGAGDINLEGFSAYGAPIFCPWARINRMTKESMYKVKVETSCGSRGGNDLHPVRTR